MFYIGNIDITLPEKDFEDKALEIINNSGENYDFETKELSTRNGLNVYQCNFKNIDEGHQFSIVAKKEKNNIHFCNIALGNYNNSFYRKDYDEDRNFEDTIYGIIRKIALDHKGDLSMIIDWPNNCDLIIEGKQKEVKGLAFVDNHKHIYSINGSETIDDSDDDDTDVDTFIPKLLINEWLNSPSNASFKKQIDEASDDQKFDIMAQAAMFQKMHNFITASEFRDLIIQIGNFAEMSGVGFTNDLVKTVYTFFS